MLGNNTESSCAEIFKRARSDIFLQDIGIEKIKIRHSKAGELLIKVYRQDNKERADDLANRMVRTLPGVTVRRPIKQGELRLTGVVIVWGHQRRGSKEG